MSMSCLHQLSLYATLQLLNVSRMSNNRGHAVVPNVVFVISDSLSIFRLTVSFESWVVSWILPIRSREDQERKPKNSKEQKPSWPNLSLMVIVVSFISFHSTMYKATTLYTSATNSATLISPMLSFFSQRTPDKNDCQVDPGKGKSCIDCTKGLFCRLLTNLCFIVQSCKKRPEFATN